MKFNRIGRILVCLVLICALVVNISPIKAQATGAGAALGVIKGASLVSVPVAFWAVAALVAIGVLVDQVNDADYTQYNSLVDNVTTFLTDAGTYVKDGMIDMYRVVDETGKAVYYAAGDAMESVRGWLFDSGVVTNQFQVPDHLIDNTNFLSTFDSLKSWPYSAIVLVPNGNVEFIRSYSALVIDDSNVIRTVNDSSFECMTLKTDGTLSGWTSIGGSVVSQCEVSFLYYGVCKTLSSPLDLVLGHISSVPIDGTGAREWSEEYTNNGLYIVGTGGNGNNNPNDGKWFWPLAFGLTAAELYAMSQADQWAGETPAEFEQYETKEEFAVSPGTEVEFGQSIELSPSTGSDPAPDTGGDSTTDPDDESAELTWWQRFTKWFQELRTSINELPDRFDEHFENVNNNIEEVPSKFESWINGVQTSVDAVAESILGTADEINAAIQGLPDNFLSHVSVITDAIGAIPQVVVVGLRSALEALFVPDPDFIPNKVAALQAKYTFLKPIESTFTDLKLFFQTMGTTPPIIYIDLGAATSFYSMGGKVKFIDLTWFSQYKATSDFIIGSFLWLWFAWRMLHALPGILQGTSGMWGHADPVPDFTFRPAPTALPGGDEPKFLGTSNYRGSRSKREYFKHHGG